MFKGTCAFACSSDSSDDKGEDITLAQLNREKRSAPEDEGCDLSVHIVEDSSSCLDNEQEEEKGEDLQEPMKLEELLVDEVVPSKLKDVWMRGRSPNLLMKIASRN